MPRYGLPGRSEILYSKDIVYDDEVPLVVNSVPTGGSAGNSDRLPSVSVRNYFPELWLWDLVTTGYVFTPFVSLSLSNLSLFMYVLHLYSSIPIYIHSYTFIFVHTSSYLSLLIHVDPYPFISIHIFFSSIFLCSENGEAEVGSKLPHTITEWVGKATCINKELGLGVSETASVTTFQSFFLSATLPYSAVRQEQVPIGVTVFNYLMDCLPVCITIIAASWSLWLQVVECQLFYLTGTGADEVIVTVSSCQFCL